MSEHGPAPEAESIYDESDTSTGRSAVRIASVAALGGFLFGYDSAVINGAVSAIEREYQVGSAELGFAVASALLGAAAGAVFAGRLADRVGRLSVMKLAAVLFFISAFGTGFANSLMMVVIFRIVGGLGVGAASVIAPAYIAEIAPAKIRGRLGSLQQLAIVSGIFMSLLIDYLLARAAGGSSEELWLGLEAWRWMFFAMAIPAVIYGVLSLTIPESPRYLVATHKVPEARKVLTTLLGQKNLDIKIDQIQRSLSREKKPSMADIKGPAMGLMPIVWIGIGLSVFQQFVGINVIFYYSNVLWEAVGFSEDDSFKITVITSVVNILTTLIAIATVDRIGRKPLLIIGSIGMTISLGVMALVFGTASTVTNAAGEVTPVLEGAQGPIALVAANVFVIAFGMSWGPIVWVLLGETFPNRIRAAALSLAAGAQWVANWLITVSFPSLKDVSLGLAYGLYCLFALLSLIFVKKFVQETKGKELEDMTG
ncbi:SP family sugar:H+ symporter-like MFS transporter [Barrientosiimonas humi]|uniref:SP family sugar:H+ symporter-like MFS transporter n=2 Tax=Barrientosiimonas TaxID=1535207 RepID=A0A542XFR6_9MICO|nr:MULTISPECIES: sugar porter family MFS transporter [Barrientosiimonas]TQL34664.1 SP family sugar:H+ symporter-like MFS transporter [Barrientosiimonas humi]BDZ59776.1 MFS transporter [Barrientosiimonas endolithica]CAG7574654.1 D-xylose-proton symporter [Barrientosiimonas humi]